MSHPLLLPLESCTNPALAGGKAVGLQRLIRAGFRVPSGFCLTTAAYHDALREAGFDAGRHWQQAMATTGSDRDRLLSDCRQAIRSAGIAHPLRQTIRDEAVQRGSTHWAVRSSATDEDTAEATCAGIYTTVLGVSADGLAGAILDCWVSIWTATALAYHERLRASRPPAMAVVLQPMLAPRAAGVAYSRHPVTGQPDIVMINAVRGLAEPLVSGQIIPDQFMVRTGDALQIMERCLADADQEASQPALSDSDACLLAKHARAIEQKLGHPVDVEWALADGALWFLQARAIPPMRAAAILTEPMCVWSRANFKETMPDLPSPLGLSFLKEFMDRAILRHYRTLGCTMPPGVSSVRVIHGRPYINVSLFQFFMAQLGGNPDSITDQMGGQLHPLPVRPPRLPLWRLIPAGIWMEWQMRRAARVAPRWFADIKRMADDHRVESAPAPAGLLARLDQLSRQLYERDLTFPTVGGVSQGLYVLRALLEHRLGREGHALLNASLQGSSQAISAQQIFRLMELAEIAGQEPAARAFLLAESWEPSQFRGRLAGAKFLQDFDAYLADYGHRAVGESDMMSPRFSEMPEYLMGIIRVHLQQPPARSVAAMRLEQDVARASALQRIRAAFGWQVHEWLFFLWCHRRLARYLALREANRHALMHFSMASRRLLLRMGEHFAASRVFAAPDDIFFLTPDEIRDIVRDSGRDWKGIVATRRAEREQNAQLEAPDTIVGTGPAAPPSEAGGSSKTLTGLPISPGCVEGPVRLIRSPDDQGRVRPGDIVVVPVIDPGMAPLFGLAAGVVAEMGGTLSHGAIIVREYGLPAVANVPGVMRRLTDGERVLLDASRGEVRKCSA